MKQFEIKYCDVSIAAIPITIQVINKFLYFGYEIDI